MNLITRYIVFELAKTFSVALIGMTGLMVLLFLGTEGMKQGLGPGAILQLLPYVLPKALYVAIPGTILFSVCLVYGRMSSSNEIVAVKSAGISAWVVIFPALIFAFFASVLTLYLNDLAASWGRKGIYKVALYSVEETLYNMLRSSKSFSNNRFSLNVGGVDGETMIYPTLVYQGGKETKTVSAHSAILKSFPEEGYLEFKLFDATANLGEDRGVGYFDEIGIPISLRDLTRKIENEESPSGMALAEIPHRLKEQDSNITQLRRQLAAETAARMFGGDFELLSDASWKSNKKRLKDAKKRKSRLETEPYRRWANGFSCLFFVLVGTPLAIRLKNADVWTCFGLTFLPILLTYFPLMLLGVNHAKSGTLPPIAVWTGNFVLCAIGCFMIRKILRH